MSKFNPEKFGFVKLADFEFPGPVAVFELGNHPAVDGRVDVLRLNIYLSRDGSFVNIWNGLVEPMFAEAKFELPKELADFIDFNTQYHEQLFRGYIATNEEAEVVLHTLRVKQESRSLPQVLLGAPHDLRCEMLPR